MNKEGSVKSRLEVNFIRLIDETQHIANGDKPKDWKFDKYVQWLQEKIPEMEKSPNSPPEERLKHYKRQVEFLKGVLEADKCKPMESSAAVQLIPHGKATTSDQVINQQIHQRAQTKTTNKLRQELLGLDSSSDSDVRNRKLIESFLSDNYQDQMVIEEKRREKMVEDMIAMTREWKEQSRVAGRVIKKDVETIDNSSRLADTNETHLKIESNRLSEFTSKTCSCWIWLIILFICCTFISMVMFIKIFPKRVVAPTPTS